MNQCDGYEEEPQNQEIYEEKSMFRRQQFQGTSVFNVELTGSQHSVISKMLPKRYTLQIERKAKNKKTNSRRRHHFTSDNRSRVSKDDNSMMVENISPPPPAVQPVHTMSYDDMIRRAQKILAQLKKNKNSWPFLEPVDSVALGIPHYMEIVKDPMDLRTIGQNLNEGKYLTITQFYADIELVIKNSILFNKSNQDFLKLTRDFENYYERLKNEPISYTKIISKPIQRNPSVQINHTVPRPPIQAVVKTKSQPKNSITMTEKKQLAAKLKNLPQEDLIQLARIICEGDVPYDFELDLEKMSIVKINIMKEFLQKKERKLNMYKRETHKHEEDEDGESSFQSDSDS